MSGDAVSGFVAGLVGSIAAGVAAGVGVFCANKFFAGSAVGLDLCSGMDAVRLDVIDPTLC